MMKPSKFSPFSFMHEIEGFSVLMEDVPHNTVNLWIMNSLEAASGFSVWRIEGTQLFFMILCNSVFSTSVVQKEFPVCCLMLCCCHLSKTWNDLSFTAVTVLNGAAAQHFQGQCQVHMDAMQSIMKSWVIIYWIWSLQTNRQKFQVQNSYKVVSLARESQQRSFTWFPT